ncbi:MAG TPA: hypothetical protein PK743_08515 [Luteimonas sp.]|nr:hypothetical protein [Luteimonas sp.]HRO28766.1 hypothetical protein [Luteimonas sp.]HRP72659.1 hypothetical protein [Luteimonas sp.]
MHRQALLAKTEMGRAEIESRARKLQGAMRSLLLLVDGRRTFAELQELAQQLHAPEDAIEQLLSLQLVSEEQAAATVGLGEAANEPVAADTGSTQSRYQVLYSQMTDIVREKLGVRGYFLQLKLERAKDDRTLEELIPDLQLALAKKTSPQGAASTIQRIRAAADLALA